MDLPRLLTPLSSWAALVALQELIVLPHVPSSDLDRARLAAWAVALAAAFLVGLSRRPRAPDAEDVGTPAGEEDQASAVSPLRELAVEEMSEGVVALDRDGRVVFANRSARDILGLKDLPHGVPMHVLGPLPHLRTTVVESWRTDRVVVRELPLTGHRKGALMVRVTPSAQGAVVVMLDVTELRRLEAGWRRFVGDSAHELRTPVAAIKANLEMLTELADLPDGPAGLLERAFRQSERLGALVEQLSRLAKLDEGEALCIRRHSLRELLVDAIRERATADPESSSRLQLQLEGVEADVLVDRDAFLRVVENLLSNAVRYSAGAVLVRGIGGGAVVGVEVEDRGAGVPEEARERVFDRFYRLHEGRERSSGGAGLGLAIARELMRAMGGEVTLSTAQPHGTVARLVVPNAGAASPAATG